ncbi:MAG: 2-dehydro-3-deoxyglucarate aldolase [Candidatus Rokubacteria bacterium]|nr:2-dehydro-3-deoxyglucarate aldolase [Candidatus Rokubacteria bacterium]
MTPNETKRKLREGKPALGVWIALGDPLIVEHLAAQGWDWLCVDTEHNPIDLATVAAMFQAIGRYPCAPLARIPEVSELGIKRILDAGAWGIVAPNIKTREEAEIVAAYAQYPPRGRRSIGSGRHALSFRTDVATYLERADDEILRVVQIEHVDALRNLDAIFSVPGIDACFIGPNDLCASMGLLPSLEPPHREFEEAIRTILTAARRHGIAPGIHTARPETASRRSAEGWRLVGCGSDLAYVTAAAKAAREAIRLT